MTVTMKNMQGKAAPNHRELSVLHSRSVCYLFFFFVFFAIKSFIGVSAYSTRK